VLANFSVKNVSVTLWFCLQVAKSVCNPVIQPASINQCLVLRAVLFVYRPAFCRVCVFILWTSCQLTNK